MNRLDFTDIDSLARVPDDEKAFAAWLDQNEVVEFLEREADDENIIIYASLPHVFIHAILIPQFDNSPETMSELREWNFSADNHWSVAGSLTSLRIVAPLADANLPLVQVGEQIFYLRSFDGHKPKALYYELNEKISHVLHVHHLPERDAWCDLNEFGDIDEIVKVHWLNSIQGNERHTVISMRASRLAEFAAIGKFTLLRMFDFTRFRRDSLARLPENRSSENLGNAKTIFGSITRCQPLASYSRGIQIVDISRIARDPSSSDEEKEYETFIANDWRHHVIGEFSCDPNKLSNYFQPTDFPFEITPAFFRPEVLTKYKADPEKYTIKSRTISCRGSWFLKAYGVNEAGQVHAYLGYLGDLPHYEQLHWKQFNEAPKAFLSNSVITTDFRGEWSSEYDPLGSLIQKLDALHRRDLQWWKLREEQLLRRVHPPLTDGLDEWASEIMNLDQLVVEGLQERWLRKRAIELKRQPDSKLRGLKLVEECLCGFGFDSDHAKEMLSVWHDVHNLRSVLKGHATTERHRFEADARSSHGTLMNHFMDLCARLDESLEVVIGAFENDSAEL